MRKWQHSPPSPSEEWRNRSRSSPTNEWIWAVCSVECWLMEMISAELLVVEGLLEGDQRGSSANFAVDPERKRSIIKMECSLRGIHSRSSALNRSNEELGQKSSSIVFIVHQWLEDSLSPRNELNHHSSSAFPSSSIAPSHAGIERERRDENVCLSSSDQSLFCSLFLRNDRCRIENWRLFEVSVSARIQRIRQSSRWLEIFLFDLLSLLRSSAKMASTTSPCFYTSSSFFLESATHRYDGEQFIDSSPRTSIPCLTQRTFREIQDDQNPFLFSSSAGRAAMVIVSCHDSFVSFRSHSMHSVVKNNNLSLHSLIHFCSMLLWDESCTHVLLCSANAQSSNSLRHLVIDVNREYFATAVVRLWPLWVETDQAWPRRNWILHALSASRRRLALSTLPTRTRSMFNVGLSAPCKVWQSRVIQWECSASIQRSYSGQSVSLSMPMRRFSSLPIKAIIVFNAFAVSFVTPYARESISISFNAT